ncbi:MAG: pyridoxamine 5'-phosphate oxidase family protein [Thalassobaculum sp.]|uniref:MSMEG_1061 family FMN-dependent PPOX-type flavoprotein n=1 Tax=Thalassobaculum sp. TaxID=2022740 RepID=UPI0032EF519A
MPGTRDDWTADLENVVTSIDEVRAAIGEPFAPAVSKVLDHVDDIAAAFIARSPFMLLASTGADGACTISPKGDPGGFVRVLDRHRLAIPDRPGNRRLDSFRNILQDPRVGLLFMVPGRPDTLRVSGEARLVRDRALRESMAVNRRTPELVTIVRVRQVYIHCPKCMIRARLWDPAHWPAVDDLTSFGDAMAAHARMGLSADEMERKAADEGVLELY